MSNLSLVYLQLQKPELSKQYALDSVNICLEFLEGSDFKQIGSNSNYGMFL